MLTEGEKKKVGSFPFPVEKVGDKAVFGFHGPRGRASEKPGTLGQLLVEAA